MHMIPMDRLFCYVSSPHYTMEILLYLLFGAFYSFSAHMTLCLIFVAINQSISGFLVHQWYQAKFKNYPAERFALMPFVF